MCIIKFEYTKRGRALLNSIMLNLGKVSTLIWLDNYFSSVDKLPNYGRTIPKTFTTIHYSLFYMH
jgi:hypothetical protein